MDKGAITGLFGNIPKTFSSVQMAGEETEARVGILNVEDEIKARRTLADILRHSKTVVEQGYIIEIRERVILTGEKVAIVRMAEHCFDRHFTVAENNLIHIIRGRLGEWKCGDCLWTRRMLDKFSFGT